MIQLIFQILQLNLRDVHEAGEMRALMWFYFMCIGPLLCSPVVVPLFQHHAVLAESATGTCFDVFSLCSLSLGARFVYFASRPLTAVGRKSIISFLKPMQMIGTIVALDEIKTKSLNFIDHISLTFISFFMYCHEKTTAKLFIFIIQTLLSNRSFFYILLLQINRSTYNFLSEL